MPNLLKIMVSSRCKDRFPKDTGRELSQIRIELKEELENVTLLGEQMFEVWINEKEPPKGGTWDSWDVCLNAVKDCDILISIYDGHAGSSEIEGNVGICQAELNAGLTTAPAKVRIISVGEISKPKNAPEIAGNLRFKQFIGKQNIFRGGDVVDEASLKERIREAVFDAVVNLAKRGVTEASLGRYHSGTPLEWTRLNYKQRSAAMVGVLTTSILQRPGSRRLSDHIFLSIAGIEVLIIPHSIPDALSVGQAKEMVGQPFLRDHEFHQAISDEQGGPLHIIACHKGATEAQAKKLLGFPDATVVDAPFGIFVADNIQKVQFAFIRDCRDETNTIHGVQRFFSWLEQNREDVLVSKRALARARIIRAIAQESD